MKNLFKVLRCTAGASAAEYAVILAVIGTSLAIASLFLGNVIAASMNDAAICMSTRGGICP